MTQAKRKQNRNVMRAAILCGETAFQTFLRRKYRYVWEAQLGEGELRTVHTMRAILGIESRKELAREDLASDINEPLKRFDKLVAEYEIWRKGE